MICFRRHCKCIYQCDVLFLLSLIVLLYYIHLSFFKFLHLPFIPTTFPCFYSHAVVLPVLHWWEPLYSGQNVWTQLEFGARAKETGMDIPNHTYWVYPCQFLYKYLKKVHVRISLIATKNFPQWITTYHTQWDFHTTPHYFDRYFQYSDVCISFI